MRTKGSLALLTTALLVSAVTAAAAWGRSSASVTSGRQAAVVISTRKVRKLGTVLVNSKGLTLYMFVPDKRAKVTCKGTCATVWPPVMLPSGAKPHATGAVDARLLGSDVNPAGGRVVTYDGWPLYTYVGDGSPGKATGQALNLNGGLWYALAPSGKVIRTKL